MNQEKKTTVKLLISTVVMPLMLIPVLLEVLEVVDIYINSNLSALNALSLVICVMFCELIIMNTIFLIKSAKQKKKLQCVIHLLLECYVAVYGILVILSRVILYST